MKRFFLVVKLLVREFVPFFAVSAGILFAGFSAAYMVAAAYSPAQNVGDEVLYLSLLLLGGLGPSLAFRKLHNPLTSHEWLVLPASAVEKFSAAWLVTSPLVILSLTLFIWLEEQGLRALAWGLFGRGLEGVNLGDEDFWTAAGLTLALGPLFLYGSLVFRRWAYVKVLLVMTGVLLGIFGFAWAGIQIGSLISGGGFRELTDLGINLGVSIPAEELWINLVIFGLLPAVFLGVGYQRLKESEVGSGVQG